MTYRDSWFGFGLGEAPTQHAQDLCAPHGGVATYAVYNDYCYDVTCNDGTQCQSGGEGCGESCSDQCPPGTAWYAPAHGCATNAASAFLQAQMETCNANPSTVWNPATSMCEARSTGSFPPAFVPGQACASGQMTGVYDANGNCVQASAYPGDDCTTASGQAGSYDGYMACIPTPTKKPIRFTPKLVFSTNPLDTGGPPPPPPPPPLGGGGPKQKTPPKQQAGGGVETTPPASSSMWPWIAGAVGVLAVAGGVYAMQSKKPAPAAKKAKK